MTALYACVATTAEAARVAEAGFDGVILPDPLAHPPPGLAGVALAIGWMSPGALPDAERPSLILTDGTRRQVLNIWRDGLPDRAELERIVGQDGAGFLLQASGRLLDTAPLPAIAALAEACRSCGLVLGLAGGIEQPDVPRLLPVRPDILVIGRAIRDALGALDPEALRMLRDLVPHDGDKVVVARRGPKILDRIFVRDLVLSIAIGAYASERGRTQRVRFSVDAALIGTGRPTREMRDVVSYDLITDAIQRLTAGRHVDFAETLAEEIAEAVLRHPRVVEVRVRVEKLDLSPGAVGVEILREKDRSAST